MFCFFTRIWRTLLRQIECVVQQLATYAGDNRTLLEALLHEFLVFTHGERCRIELFEQRTREAEQARLKHPLKASERAAHTPPAVDEQDHLGFIIGQPTAPGHLD